MKKILKLKATNLVIQIQCVKQLKIPASRVRFLINNFFNCLSRLSPSAWLYALILSRVLIKSATFAIG